MNKEPTLQNFSHIKGKIKLLTKKQRIFQVKSITCNPIPED